MYIGGVQYEIISNPETVDLLVSIAYTAAADQSLGEPLPLGMGLRVPVPDARRCFAPPVAPPWTHVAGMVAAVPAPVHVTPVPGSDGLCEFDEMGILEVCRHLIFWGVSFLMICLGADARVDSGAHTCFAACTFY